METGITRAGQIAIALALMAVIALATIITVRRGGRRHDGSGSIGCSLPARSR
jgi:hypothetical protein